MKKYTKQISIVVLTILVAFTIVHQKSVAREVMQNIDGEVLAINERDENNGFETKTLNNAEFLKNMPDGGGQLTGYFADGKIHKITERLGLSYGVMTYEYYFSPTTESDDLISVHQKEEKYPVAIDSQNLDYSKTEPAFDGVYYFAGGQLIGSREKGERRFSTPNSIKRHSETLIRAARQNIELLLSSRQI